MLSFLMQTDAGALAPMGACLAWRPDVPWLHVASYGLTALAYWSVPLALAAARRQRRTFLQSQSRAAVLIAAFAAATGTVHAVSILEVWRPEPILHGTTEVAMALTALAAAFAFLPLMPRLVSLPAAAALATANALLRREVADTRDAERRALSDRARLAGLFEHLSDGLFVVRADAGRFVFETMNPGFCRIFGRPCTDVEGADPENLLEPEAAADLERRFAACLASGRPLDWDSPSLGPSTGDAPGGRHWHTVLVPLPAGADGAPRLLGSLRDVTGLRRLQIDLVEQARRGTMSAMCAGIAHEMSQPVNIIALWSDRARRGLDAGQLRPRRAMQVVSEQTRRLGALLERMRDLVREVPEEVVDFDAGPPLAAAVEAARRAWALEGLEMPLEVSAPLVLRGRPPQFEQAVLHLLENAREAVLRRRQDDPDAPARIEVSLSPGSAPETVAVSVRDTGGGVPAPIAPRILEPFVTSKEPGEGTGLGLPIAAGIARGMGGRVCWSNVASGRPEAGAEFRLVFPAADAAARGRTA